MSQVTPDPDSDYPVPPQEPEPWQCCGSGCDPCVYDQYWDALARYEEAVKAYEQRHGQRAVEPGEGSDS